MTLADEDDNSIPTDDTNWPIIGNVAMQVAECDSTQNLKETDKYQISPILITVLVSVANLSDTGSETFLEKYLYIPLNISH